MKIGQYEIRRWDHSTLNSQLSTSSPQRMEEAAVTGALAVADDNAMWRALHQVINDMELETIQSARSATLQPNECAAHTQSGEALDLLRKRLNRLRNEGIKGNTETLKSGQAEMKR